MANYHIRSVSLPSRTHPTTQTVEDELEKLKSCEEEASTSSSSTTSAGSICYGLTGIQELYHCVDDLLNLPSTIDALFGQKNKKFVDELLDMSVRILDICGIAKDIVSQCKDNARDLQSSLRRRKGSNSNMEIIVTKYFSSRRQMKKDAKRSLVNLKRLDQEIKASAQVIVDIDNHVSSVIRVLQEVNSRTISIFQAFLKFLSVRSYKQKINKWTPLKALVQKEKVGTESSNELENADVALRHLYENDQTEMGGGVHIVQNRLQTLEGCLEGLENQLDATFRCLIRSRTKILNMFTC